MSDILEKYLTKRKMEEYKRLEDKFIKNNEKINIGDKVKIVKYGHLRETRNS